MSITAIIRTDLDNEVYETEVIANLYTVTHYGKKIYSAGNNHYSGYYDATRDIVILDGNDISDAIDYDDKSDAIDNDYYMDGY